MEGPSGPTRVASPNTTGYALRRRRVGLLFRLRDGVPAQDAQAPTRRLGDDRPLFPGARRPPSGVIPGRFPIGSARICCRPDGVCASRRAGRPSPGRTNGRPGERGYRRPTPPYVERNGPVRREDIPNAEKYRHPPPTPADRPCFPPPRLRSICVRYSPPPQLRL